MRQLIAKSQKQRRLPVISGLPYEVKGFQ